MTNETNASRDSRLGASSRAAHAMTRRSFLATAALSAGAVTATLAACGASSGDSGATKVAARDYGPLAIDSAAWRYDPDNDIYYQIGLPYCLDPVATAYESMGIYVPGAYLTVKANADGSTYTCTVNDAGRQGAYAAKTAPIVMPVNTAGYSAQKAPSEYSAKGLSSYTSAGLVYVYAGCRGRANGENADGSKFDGGAPWGATDLKAAVRCIRYNDAALPGDKAQVFTFGHSGGGAQSALMGATGDSDLYEPYLESIGAVMANASGEKISDAVAGAMCWCPITSLDVANEAYEWMMGQYASAGTRAEGTFTKALSADLSSAFVSYVNGAGFVGEGGGTLLLAEGGDGSYASGSYYDHLLGVIERSLNNFLADTEFPYAPSSQTKADGGFGGGAGAAPDGAAPDGAPAGERPSGGGQSGSDAGPVGGGPGASGGQPAGSSFSAEAVTYETVQDYVDALNSDEAWIAYDANTNTARIASVGAFVRHCKSATKDVGAFDMLDRSSAENSLFGDHESDARHFDQTMARLFADNASRYAELSGYDASYAEAFAADVKAVDALGVGQAVRQDMYNPMYYLAGGGAGFGTSTVARHWRIRTGIEQGDTSLTTEVNLALALRQRSDVANVDFETVWGKGHTTAERSGDSTENLIAWIASCV